VWLTVANTGNSAPPYPYGNGSGGYGGGYGSPYGTGWQDYGQYPASAQIAYAPPGQARVSGAPVPSSAEPGIPPPADDFGALNYGGSSPSFANQGSSAYGGSYGDEAYGAYSGGYNNPPPYSGAPGGGGYAGGGYPPPPSGQSVPLTPPEGSSPYGVPPAPDDGGGFAGPGGGPVKIRPGEIAFASAGPTNGLDQYGQPCDSSANTVTIQVSDELDR